MLDGERGADEEELVMRRNGTPIIFSPVGPDLVFYYVGSDDVDEMQRASAPRPSTPPPTGRRGARR